MEPHLPTAGTVLELGCGVGHGVLFFAERGYRVIALDAEQQALDLLSARLPANADVELVQSRFEEFELGKYDVIVAGFSLFFLPPNQFTAFWPRLVSSLTPGGLFAGQFLGVNDDWASRGYAVHTRPEADGLLRDFEVLFVDEVERDGETVQREPKHWHVFHVVARKLI